MNPTAKITTKVSSNKDKYIAKEDNEFLKIATNAFGTIKPTYFRC